MGFVKRLASIDPVPSEASAKARLTEVLVWNRRYGSYKRTPGSGDSDDASEAVYSYRPPL